MIEPHGIAYRARTPEQKREVIERLLAVWEKKPDLRLGQLLLNAYSTIYYVEDMDLVEAVERFYSEVPSPNLPAQDPDEEQEWHAIVSQPHVQNGLRRIAKESQADETEEG